MNIQENEVYTFKLNSGEEVVAKVKSIEENFLVIEEPVSVAPNHNGMGLIPSMFTSTPKDEARLNTNSVSLYGLTDEAIKLKYLEATTGLTVPPTKKIILG